MINPYKKNAKLVLSNGIVFPGFFFGASGTAIGEIVFNTGMTGYQEVITDPSYYGQILTFTYPEIGNTGINFEDSESNINVKGIIVRNFSFQPRSSAILDNKTTLILLDFSVSIYSDLVTNGLILSGFYSFAYCF